MHVLTETGLIDSIYDNEIFPDDYSVFRCDRTEQTSDKEQKGGVLIAVQNSYDPSLILKCDSIGLEQLWVKIKIKIKLKTRSIYFAALYIPPKSEFQLYERHISKIESMQSDLDVADTCFVFGDINLPNLDWNRDDEDCCYFLPNNASSVKFL